jgi:uncharacterized membrane protein YdjX (TVP38/TMEM64 family)
MITDLSFFKDALVMVESQSFGTQLGFVLGFYAIAPLCGIPITIVTYTTGCLFGVIHGFFAGYIGMLLSFTVLLEGNRLMKCILI